MANWRGGQYFRETKPSGVRRRLGQRGISESGFHVVQTEILVIVITP